MKRFLRAIRAFCAEYKAVNGVEIKPPEQGTTYEIKDASMEFLDDDI